MKASMHEAKTNLSRLVERALAGEEVVLTRGKSRTPTAKIVAIDSQLPAGEITSLPAFPDGKRPIGLYKGQFEVGPEFFEPLPEEELALWEGKYDAPELWKNS